jgi:hypothetical protein
MPKSKSHKKNPPKRVLALPDLEHAKTAVLNTLTSASGQRTYDHAIREFVTWYWRHATSATNRAGEPRGPRGYERFPICLLRDSFKRRTRLL